MIFRTGAAANKINGRLAESIQEVGFLNKHIVSKLIHTPIVYRRGTGLGADRAGPARLTPPRQGYSISKQEEKDKTVKQDFALMLFQVAIRVIFNV